MSPTGRVPVFRAGDFLVAAADCLDLWPQVYEHVPIPLTVEGHRGVVPGVDRDPVQRRHGHRLAEAPRASAGPILSLGVLERSLDRGGVAVFVSGFMMLGGCTGAALAPTESGANVVLLAGAEALAGRSGTTLEGEAGVRHLAGGLY